MNEQDNTNESPYNHLIFVCTNERAENNPRGCCLHRGGDKILMKLKEEIKSRNLKPLGVRATRSGCLDFCEDGANVVIYGKKEGFDGTWYQNVSPDDVNEIIESHILKGIPVERLRNKFRK